MESKISLDLNKIRLNSEADKLPNNKYEFIVRQKIADLYENIIGQPLSSSKALFDVPLIAAEYHPECEDEKILFHVSLINFQLFLLDDFLEENLSEAKYWADIYEQKIEPNPEKPLEMFYIKCIESVESICNDSQKKRYFELLIDYLKFYSIHIETKAGNKSFTIEEYMLERKKEGAVDLELILVEPVLGVELDDNLRNHDMIQNYYKLYLDLIILTNDIFSYEKEAANNDPFNYISMKIKNNNTTPQEAMDSTIDNLNELYEKFLICKKNIIDSELEVSVEYLDAIDTIVVGHYRWYLFNGRYGRSQE